MTDITQRSDPARRVSSVGGQATDGLTATVRRLRPWLPLGSVFAGASVGLAAGHAMAASPDAFEDKLVLLLRFMAVVKGIGVLCAAAVTHWRLTKPVSDRAAFAYGAALASMAAAPGLIWGLGAIALGALIFHAGLLAFLGLAWADRQA